jgi:hypothetical protein
MNQLRAFRRTLLFPVVAFCFLCLSLFPVPGYAGRGDAPRCQEECLGNHIRKMGQISKEYSKGRDKTKYQSGVEEEVTNYSGCLTECRDVLPIK